MCQLGRYTSFAVDVEDVTGRRRTFSASNRQTVARLGEDVCSLPLQLTDEWNKANQSTHSDWYNHRLIALLVALTSYVLVLLSYCHLSFS